MRDSLFLKDVSVHADWLPFFDDENLGMLRNIEAEISGMSYTPSAEKVLRFLSLPLSSAKVLILGQDPYPQYGVATGRAFEVGNLRSWNQSFQNISLKNILRAVYKAYYGEVILFSHLREKIFTEFPVLPPNKLFGYWEKQGVILLNTSFTCKPGEPGSHQFLWKEFTGRLLDFISRSAPNINWFIWGDHALNATKRLTIQHIRSKHPMMCYYKPGREADFLYGTTNCFQSFTKVIDWTGFAFNEKHNQQYNLF